MTITLQIQIEEGCDPIKQIRQQNTQQAIFEAMNVLCKHLNKLGYTRGQMFIDDKNFEPSRTKE